MGRDSVKSGRATMRSRPSLKVAELFASIQGESSFAGMPSAFIRLAGCNLRCRYCDTSYAWEDGKEMEIEEIAARITKMGQYLVCVTGGEPLLQQGTKRLATMLLRQGHEVLVETNGSLPINILPARVRKIVDVKTPGSGEGGSFLRANLADMSSCDELKFVLTGRSDFDWSLRFIQRNRLEGRLKMLMSPAYGLLEAATLAGWIIRAAMPLRLNVQLHKILWGADARGV